MRIQDTFCSKKNWLSKIRHIVMRTATVGVTIATFAGCGASIDSYAWDDTCRENWTIYNSDKNHWRNRSKFEDPEFHVWCAKQRNGDINAIGEYSGETHLHAAAEWVRNPVIIEELVKNGADVKAKDNNGNTPLHWAVMDRVEWHSDKGNVDVIWKLIRLGADPNAKNNEGDTPLHLAATAGLRPSVTSELNYKNSKIRSTSNYIITTLIERGADVNSRNNNGETPLHVAIDRPKRGVNSNWNVMALLKGGADVSLKDYNGRIAANLVQTNSRLLDGTIDNTIMFRMLVPEDSAGQSPLESGSFPSLLVSAIDGDPTAQFLVGIHYAQGLEGVIQRDDTAKRWFRRAAIQDHVESQYLLGVVLFNTSSYEHAYIWLSIAQMNGHDEAREALGQLAAFLRGDKLTEAKKKLQRCQNELWTCRF